MGGFDGWEARLADSLIASVVEDDVGGEALLAIFSNAALEAFEEDVGGGGEPVFDDDVPLNGGHTEVAGGAQDVGPAGSVGWAEEADGGAEGVFESGVTVGELLADAGVRLPGEPGVVLRMVADDVASGGDGAGDLRTLADVAADHEEGGADLVAGEDFEEAFGGEVVGAVVVGEGDLFGAAGGDEDGAEDLGLGLEGGIRSCTCGCGGEEGGGGDGGGMRHRLALLSSYRYPLLVQVPPSPGGYLGWKSFGMIGLGLSVAAKIFHLKELSPEYSKQTGYGRSRPVQCCKRCSSRVG